ncbi:MAG: threonine dehydratase [Gammaproteobacteria bacterium]
MHDNATQEEVYAVPDQSIQRKPSAPDFKAVKAAAARIEEHVHRTPVMTSHSLNELIGAQLFFKCENLQRAGAFKFRGATNAVMMQSDALLREGFATHSSGNHAAALTLAASLRGAPATVVMPSNSNRAKKEAVRAYGGTIVECEPNQDAREAMFAEVVARTGAEPVPPFDDTRVIAGQATAALELLDTVNDLDAIIAPVGGGGLLAGTVISAAAIATGPGTHAAVYGAEPATADDTYRSFQARERIVLSATPETIADGLRTSIGVMNFPIIRDGAAGILTANEAEIARAMRLLFERMKLVVEPSGALPLACLLERAQHLAGKRIGIILSGGNVDLKSLPW